MADTFEYTLTKTDRANGTTEYYASFIDGTGAFVTSKISEEVYLVMDEQRKAIQSRARTDKRHMEQSELTEESLESRMAVKETSYEEKMIIDEQIAFIRSILSETQFRRFVLLSQKKTQEQIALIEGTSRSAVNMSILEARKKLKKYF